MDVSGRNGLVDRVPWRTGLLVVACLVSLLVLGVTGPAQAHTDLVGSSPGADRVVPATTDRLELTFSEELAAVGGRVVVRDRAGHEATQGEPRRFGSSLLVRLRRLEPGRHEVAYRVVGEDGHAVTGSYPFVAAPAGSRGSSNPAVDRGGVSEVRDSEGPGVTPASTAGATEGGTTGSPLRWVLPAAAGLALVLMVLHGLFQRVARAARRA